MTPEEAKQREEWGVNMWTDPNKHVSANDYDTWVDWADAYYADDPEMLHKVKAQGNSFMLLQSRRREEERAAAQAEASAAQVRPETVLPTQSAHAEQATAHTNTQPTVVEVPAIDGEQLAAARERVEQMGGNRPAEDVLPAASSLPSADQKTVATQRAGSVGGSTQTGVSEQFGSQSSTGTSTSEVGNLTPERQAELDARMRAMAESSNMDYDPTTGKLTPKRSFVTDVLGVDPAVMRRKRQEEEELNRAKQKEIGLYNALSVLGDMITTAAGGNVWKREDNGKAKEARDRNIQLEREQLAEDQAYADKLNKAKQDTLNKINELQDKYMSLYAPRTQSSSNSSASHQAGISESAGSQWQQSASTSQQATTYSDALKGRGLRGYSHGSGSGSSSRNVDYLPIRLLNAPHGQEYISIEMQKSEKEALSHAIAASVRDAAAAGDTNAQALLNKYYTAPKPAEYRRGKVVSPEVKEKWNYDGLINDSSLYNVPGALNRYLDELERLAITHNVNGKDVRYTRNELYVMMTGDDKFEHVPAGVILGSSRI